MKRFALVLLAGFAGYLGYTRMSSARYGISEDAPLGTFEKLDAHLTELGLVKADFRGVPDRNVPASQLMYRYTNRENEYEYVTLLLDRDETLQGTLATYWLGDFGSRSPVMLFGQAHWRQLGGERDPEFEEIDRTRNTTTTEATLPPEGAQGWWRVWADEGQREVRIYVHR